MRMLGFLRGKHHTEEIIWRLKITREDFQLVKHKYKDIIVTVMHEAEEET